MEFRTEYHARPSLPISLTRPILLIGSCFADNVGKRLRSDMVDAVVNPCGTLFNPQSIANVVNRAIAGEEPEYEESKGCWFSWLLPTEFSSFDREEAITRGTSALATLRNALKEAGTIVVTLGTAIVYSLSRPPFGVVSNCHKHPSSEFFRDIMSPEAVAAAMETMIERIRRENPNVRFIFTVSPVRHLKEGFHANTLSKATLQLGLARVLTLHEGVGYFPAYEILNDDLRDYRFFATDMLHPSEQAVEYIYEKFKETYISDSDNKLLDRAAKIRRRMNHRPLHPDTATAKSFAEETDHQLAALLADAPYLRE